MCFFNKKKAISFRTRIEKIETDETYNEYIKESMTQISKKFSNSCSDIKNKDIQVFDRFLSNLEKILDNETARTRSCVSFLFEDMLKVMANGRISENYEKEKLRYEANFIKSKIYAEISKLDNLDKSQIPLSEVQKIIRLDYLINEVKDNDLAKNLEKIIILKEVSFEKFIERYTEVNKKKPYKTWNDSHLLGNYMMNMLDIVKENLEIKKNELYVRFAKLEYSVEKLNKEMANPTLREFERHKIAGSINSKNIEMNEIVYRINEFLNNYNQTTKMEYFKIGVYNDDYNQVKVQIFNSYNGNNVIERSTKLTNQSNEIDSNIETNKIAKVNPKM